MAGAASIRGQNSDTIEDVSGFEELSLTGLSCSRGLVHGAIGIGGQAYEEQFMHCTYQPRTIRLACLIGVAWYFYEFMNTCFTCSMGEDGAGGDGLWILGTWIVEPIVGTGLLIVATVFSLKSLQSFCKRNYNGICIIFLVSANIALILPRVMIEIRLSMFQRHSLTHKYDHIHWEIDASNFPPTRKCNDTRPLLSWSNHTNQSPVGCNSVVLSGAVYSFLLLIALLPTILHMPWECCLIASITNSSLYLAALLCTGSAGSAMISAVVFHLVAGLFASYFCAVRRRIAWAEFSVERSIERASERSGNLLYTLIPRNIMARLASHRSSDMLGRAIPHCTVMFCSLEQEEDLQAAFTIDVFDLLCSLFAEFDDAVKRSGMFKYQHVGGWYIVACPRAERPFDEGEYAAEYPQHYTLSMLHLAHELRRIAVHRSFRGAPLRLQVGLHCGPAAGAVIGVHRAFYCLYGDTVNTAARMCKCAGGGGVRGSRAMAEAVRRLPEAWGARCQGRGSQEVKGKGVLETFELLLAEGPPDAARRRQSMALAARGAAADPRLGLGAPPPGPGGPQSAGAEVAAAAPGLLSTRWLREAVWRAGETMRAEGQTDRLDRFWAIFADPDVESRFVAERLASQRRRLKAGLVLHASAVVLQYVQIRWQEFSDFQAYGDSALAEAKAVVDTLLAAHCGAAGAACITLLSAVWLRVTLTPVCGALFMVVQLAHVAVSIACYAFIPGDGWLVLFPLQFLLLGGWMGVHRFRTTLYGCTLAMIVHAISVPSLRQYPTATIWLTRSLVSVLNWVGAVLVSRTVNLEERQLWLRAQLEKEELGRLRDKLSDLLPQAVSQRIVSAYDSRCRFRKDRISEMLPCKPCHAAVLELDVVGFTAMSQEMDALDVARLMHCLFSAFDTAILNAGLFKMDTIGDAYVAAGFLPKSSTRTSHLACRDGGNDKVDNAINSIKEGEAEVESEATRQACERVLRAARDMIAAVAACRRETGHDIHCRIGVSTGEVIAGILGHLQPRFHIFGAGLSTAERHEKTGEIDTVHASPAFMAALALKAQHRDEGNDCSLQASAAAAAALEYGAGSSGQWSVRQSAVIDSMPGAASCAATPTAIPSPGTGDLEAANLNHPSNRLTLLRAVAKSFRFSQRSAGGSFSEEISNPFHCAQLNSKQHSFILMPQSDPDSCDCSQSGCKLPGLQGLDLPTDPMPAFQLVRSRSFAAGLPSLQGQSRLQVQRSSSSPFADVCLDPPSAWTRSCQNSCQSEHMALFTKSKDKALSCWGSGKAEQNKAPILDLKDSEAGSQVLKHVVVE